MGGLLASAGLALALLIGGFIPALLGFFLVGLGVAAVSPCVYAAAAKNGAVALALDGLSANATLATAAGVTGASVPGGSPVALANIGPDNVLSPGESATLVLQFNNPSRAAITYSTRVLAGVLP